MEGGGEVGICWSGSGVFSPSSNIDSSSLSCSKEGREDKLRFLHKRIVMQEKVCIHQVCLVTSPVC